MGAADKPAAESITSFVRSGAPLQKGVWYAFLRADGKIAKRVAVRITKPLGVLPTDVVNG